MDELASKWGFDYSTVKAAIDEGKIGNRRRQPGELVTLLAKAKADAILQNNLLEDGYLLTCDQVYNCFICPDHGISNGQFECCLNAPNFFIIRY
jgi:predicted house-cleaning NTP pyrophosphatase (Maf/HAM1 superfamily)